jgi:hypothetical protein
VGPLITFAVAFLAPAVDRGVLCPPPGQQPPRTSTAAATQPRLSQFYPLPLQNLPLGGAHLPPSYVGGGDRRIGALGKNERPYLKNS